jgi:acetyltransferase-like isoleucine patch superfamily enzyme
MRLLSGVAQWWIRKAGPKWHGAIARLLYRSDRVRFGRRFRCDGVPRIIVDPGATVVIGDDVEFRSAIEIRAHGTSRVEIGSNVRVDRGVRLLAANESIITIGAGARIGLHTVFNGGASISVGLGSLISGFVYLQTSMHRFKSRETMVKDQGYDHADIAIGNNAWLAAHVVIMPGCRIGDDAIVGSNAVVTGDVEAGHIVVGIPARTIRDLNERMS